MSENELKSRRGGGSRFQSGAAAVEFALVASAFLLIVFGVIEIARALYVINTLQEVTRRGAAAAAKTDFTNQEALKQVRQEAIFRQDSGNLPFGDPVTDDNIVIDYLSISQVGTSLTIVPTPTMPASPEENRQTCMKNPYASDCIQFVRVRVCSSASATSCDNVPYKTIFPMFNFSLKLPIATTITKVDSLTLTCLPCNM